MVRTALIPKKNNPATITSTVIGLLSAPLINPISYYPVLKVIYKYSKIARSRRLIQQRLPNIVRCDIVINLGPVQYIQGLGKVDNVCQPVFIKGIFLIIGVCSGFNF